MITRLILVLLCSVGPLPTFANCAGKDLRLLMTPDAAAKMNEAVRETPFAQGNHWVATKDAKTVHLIGTIHVGDPRLDPVMDRLRATITSADAILLEATPVEQKALQSAVATRPELIFLTDGPTLPELMTEDDWQSLSLAAKSRGIPPFLASKFQPWYLSLLLGVPGCAMRESAGGKRGLDHLIMAQATEAGIPMRPLEDFDTLFGLFAAEPIEDQIKLLIMSILPDEESEDALFTLTESFFDQNTAEAWEFARYLAHQRIPLPAAEIEDLFAELEDIVLTQRNAAWMPRIEGAPENNIVVAVGAAHLIGKNGVLQRLSTAGFTLSRKSF